MGTRAQGPLSPAPPCSVCRQSRGLAVPPPDPPTPAPLQPQFPTAPRRGQQCMSPESVTKRPEFLAQDLVHPLILRCRPFTGCNQHSPPATCQSPQHFSWCHTKSGRVSSSGVTGLVNSLETQAVASCTELTKRRAASTCRRSQDPRPEKPLP